MKFTHLAPFQKRLVAPVVVAVLALSVTACADKYVWENWNLAKHRWAADNAECRSNASKLIDDELKSASPFNTQERGPLEQQFSLFDARKRRDQMFRNCMRDKGYKRVKLKPGVQARPKSG